MTKQVMQQALDALKDLVEAWPELSDEKDDAAIATLEQAIKQTQEEQSFDSWKESPYTKVLEKSIAEDYVPRYGGIKQQGEPVGQIDGDGFPMLFGHKPINPGVKLYTSAPTIPEGWTAREIELFDGMIEVQKNHADRCDAIQNRTMAAKQKAWDIERINLLQKCKAMLSAAPKPGDVHG